VKSLPKKPSIVLAFAGDSTMTKLLIDFEKKIKISPTKK